MSEYTTFARPYARAIYDLAKEESRTERWSAMLSLVAEAATQEQVVALFGDPRIADAVLAQIVIDLCGDGLDAEGRNLVRLLAENRRLTCVTELAALFEHLRAQGEGLIEAEVVSARPLDEKQRAELVAALKRRLGRDVTLNAKEDATLMGGVVVRAGDLVIDGSLKGRLGQLARAMSR